MYIQRCVKGIAGQDSGHSTGLTWTEAQDMVSSRKGIVSNWWRHKGTITAQEIADVLTEQNLDSHLHDYASFGGQTPFISLAAGAVERDTLVRWNFEYNAVDTALGFATEDWARPGALFYCWLPTSLNRTVEVEFVAEAVRDLLVYRGWSPWQLEGEVTAKVHVPSNQIECVEWWDGTFSRSQPQFTYRNSECADLTRVTNFRNLF
jgi:hypothetical protein